MRSEENTTKRSVISAMLQLGGWTRACRVAEVTGYTPATAGVTMKLLSKQGVIDRQCRKILENKHTRMISYYKLTRSTRDKARRWSR
jgi:hypothetical protein